MFKQILITVLITITGVMFAAAPAAQAQTTWYVDDDAPNDPGPGDPTVSDPLEDGSPEHPFDAIQEGIDAAADGDTVLVLDGTYTGVGNRNLDFGGSLITLRSENGPESCVIDCEQGGRGLYFHSAETAEAAVEGFTITNGSADWGGGMCNEDSSPTVTNCTFSGNSAGGDGGGICNFSNSTARVTNCTLTGNVAGRGAGIACCFGASPTIRDSTVEHNSAWIGGGLYCEEGAPSIIRCVIHGNTASGTEFGEGGGGVFCYDYYCRATFRGCTISGNEANVGGGVYCFLTQVQMANCAIVENASSFEGGGIALTSGAPTIINCTIAANVAQYGGGSFAWDTESLFVSCAIVGNVADEVGGIYALETKRGCALVNCTVTGNEADSCGGIKYELYECRGVVGVIANCVVWDNFPSEITFDCWDCPTVSYCNVRGGWPGEGNINADPLFVDPDGADDDPNTFDDNDYRLATGSPCIDAGDNTAVPADVLDLDGDGDTEEPIPFDLDGNPRFVDDPDIPDSGNGIPPIVDMGAYEFGILGDLDGDCDVDSVDLARLLSNYGTPSGAVYADGDLDRDGDVDLTDLAALLAVYGTSCP